MIDAIVSMHLFQDWSVMRNFAQRNVSRPGDMLHRDSRTPRRQHRGDEWVSVMGAMFLSLPRH